MVRATWNTRLQPNTDCQEAVPGRIAFCVSGVEIGCQLNNQGRRVLCGSALCMLDAGAFLAAMRYYVRSHTAGVALGTDVFAQRQVNWMVLVNCRLPGSAGEHISLCSLHCRRTARYGRWLCTGTILPRTHSMLVGQRA